MFAASLADTEIALIEDIDEIAGVDDAVIEPLEHRE